MKASKFILPAALAVFFLVLPGCGQDKEEQQSAKINTPIPLPETMTITGQVQQKLDAGNFMFVLISSDKKIIWVTVPKVEVEIGETVTMKDANLLENFHSRTLNKTFREVLFSPGIEGKTPMIKKASTSSVNGERQERRSQRLMSPPK